MYHRLSSFAEIFTPLSKIIERYVYTYNNTENQATNKLVFSCDCKKIPKDAKVSIIIYTVCNCLNVC